MKTSIGRALIVAGLGIAGAAYSQTAEWPSTKRISAPLVTPSNAWTYYGSGTTHTDGVGYSATRAPEIKELARGLGASRYTNDMYALGVYEYVRNNIAVDFRFGLSKGGRGALIDQSGTAFDQAQLMVELLREGGVSASYEVGTISITAAQFQSWTGIATSPASVNAVGACQFLADGGIPALVNGATGCGSLSGLLPSSGTPITMGHVWVRANGRIYDPAYKVHAIKSGVDVYSAMGCGSAASPTCAPSILGNVPATQTVGGVQQVTNVNQAGLESSVSTLAVNLQNYIQNTNATNYATNPNMQVEDLVGGSTIDIGQPLPQPGDALVSALPSSAYPGSPAYSWGGEIPDGLRTTLTVQIDNLNGGAGQLLYADETYGKRLRIWGDGVVGGNRRLSLYIEYKPVATSSLPVPDTRLVPLTLTIGHPYSANAGAYADEAIVYPLKLQSQQSELCTQTNSSGCTGGFLPSYVSVVSIVPGLGAATESTISHFSALAGRDVTNVVAENPGDSKHLWRLRSFGEGVNDCLPEPTPAVSVSDPGCFEQHQSGLGATWLAQESRAIGLISQVNRSTVQQHHALAVVFSGDSLASATEISAHVSLSVNSKANVANDVKAATYSIGSTVSRLEGSVIGEQLDSADGWDAISMAAFSNSYATPFLRIDSSNATAGFAQLVDYSASARSVLQQYVNAGHVLIVPKRGKTGPFCSANDFACYTADFAGVFAHRSGDGQLAYLSLGMNVFAKGAGAPANGIVPQQEIIATTQVRDYAQKGRSKYSVNLVDGSFVPKPDPDLVTGVGTFPRSLHFQRVYSPRNVVWKSYWNWQSQGVSGGGQGGYSGGGSGAARGGWTNNFAISAAAGSDGLQSLGSESALNASGALTALYLQRALVLASTNFRTDIRSVLALNFVTHWFGSSIWRNMYVLHQPPNSTTFVRLPDKSWNAPPGSGDQLIQQGELGANGVEWGLTARRVFDSKTLRLTWRRKDGSEIYFVPFGIRDYPDNVIPRHVTISRLSPEKWTFPDGTIISFNYGPSNVIESFQSLLSVSNNLGRSLIFPTNVEYPAGTLSAGELVKDETGRTVRYSIGASAYPEETCQPLNSLSIDCEYPASVSFTMPDGAVHRYDYVQNPRSLTGVNRQYSRISSWTAPTGGGPYLSVGYDSLFRVKDVTDIAGNTFTYFTTGLYGRENQKRGETRDPLTGVVTKYFDSFGNQVGQIDELGRTTYQSFDTARRLVRKVLPEQNFVTYTYDIRHNKLSETNNPKPGSGLASIATSATFEEGPTVLICANPKTCNRVKTSTDSKGNVTTYDSVASTGQLQRVRGPSVTVNGVAGSAQTDYCYQTLGGVSFLRGKIDKVDNASTRVSDYTYNAGNKYVLQSAVVDPSTSWGAPATAGGACTTATKSGALNFVSTFAFDGVGNVASIDGPRTDLTDVTDYTFDTMRRITRVQSPSVMVNGTAVRPITRYTYDTDGLLRTTRRSQVVTPTDATPANPWPTDLVASHWQTETRDYYPIGDLLSVTDAESNVTQYKYDALGRGTLVTDPDSRRTGTVYDLAGQTLCTWKAWNLATAPTDCAWTPPATYSSGPMRYAAFTYSNNGKQQTIQDANKNQTDLVYDKQDRLRFTFFPSPSSGSRCTSPSGETGSPTCPTGSTYEELWYTTTGAPTATRCSANDQPCRKRMRDGQTITYNTYDALDRLITKTPQGQGAVTHAYNLLSEPTSISEVASGSNYAAHSTTFAYDGAGRKTSETNDGRIVSYQYDNAGNRARTTWPDNYFVSYQYDALNRMQYVRENSISANEIAFYDYDIQGRRNKLRFAANEGNKTTYSYELDNQLDVLTQALNTATVTLDYGHNRSGQVTGIAANDDFYLAKPVAALVTAYVPDKLNRYGSVAGQANTYSNSGNLLTWFPLNGGGQQTYTYDSENRLVSAAVNGSGTVTIRYDYDALGRRQKKTVNGTATQYLLDGDEEIAELDGAGVVLRRYITGPSIDDRIARAEGSATSNPPKSYYHVNHQGSVIATTDATGTATQTLSYDEYGKLTSAAVTTGEQFRYTGRRFDPETGLYYYRARYYTPDLGRFLQTDPVGYKDDFNLYAYVGNDPVSKVDPMGTSCVTTTDSKGVQSAQSCKIDVNRDALVKKFGTAMVAKLELAYKNAVNKMLHAPKYTSVTLDIRRVDGKGFVRSTASAANVASQLIRRQISYTPSDPNAMSTNSDGTAGAVSDKAFDNGGLTTHKFHGLDRAQTRAWVHEGMHSPEVHRQLGPDSVWKDNHTEPFEDSAQALLDKAP